MSHLTEKEQQFEIQGLIKDLSADDKLIRTEARHSLVMIGEPAIKPLISALGDNKANIRWEIAKALTEMFNPEAAPVLVKTLEDENPEIRWLAAEGLIALGRKSLLPLLNALINRPDSLWLRMGSHHILSDLYTGEVHESEGAFLPIYSVSKIIKDWLRPVLIAMESMDHNILLPVAAKKAFDLLISSGET